jgi:Nitrile hydratase beta subunit, N-terminal
LTRAGASADDAGNGGAMDGVHDLGGMHGFGPVEREDNEPAFHAL